MTFLNTALAFGAAAFAVPLIIHILNLYYFIQSIFEDYFR